MNDALSSFYSDLASIDAPSDGCNSFDQNKSGPFQDAPFSSKLIDIFWIRVNKFGQVSW